jgi:hypothetical protein
MTLHNRRLSSIEAGAKIMIRRVALAVVTLTDPARANDKAADPSRGAAA